MQLLRYFGWSLAVTIAALLAVGLGLGLAAVVTTLVLIAIETAFSFDNAVVNAKLLGKLSAGWQRLFLTVGMLIAIVGMRLVFPIVIVMITAQLSWSRVIDLALHHSEAYGQALLQAHPAIAAFGGAFLLTLSLYFFLDDEREIRWLERLERRLQRIGGRMWTAPLIAAIVVVICGFLPANHHAATTWRAGLAGVLIYSGLTLLTALLGRLTQSDQKTAHYTGWAAFGLFAYLEVLDASFSFDGVLGAFAITSKVILIAAGLGVGALWVRSLTVFMVHRQTLSEYRYLEHGAHYAIAFLSIALLISIFWEVPDAVTGITGLGIIVASWLASRQARQLS